MKSRKHSRTALKRRFIWYKNQINGKEGTKGIFYTHHAGFSDWIDFYFLSKYHKGKVFSVAMVTLELELQDSIWEECFSKACEEFPMTPEAEKMEWVKVPGRKVSRLVSNPERLRQYRIQTSRAAELEAIESAKPKLVRPSIAIDTDYWPPKIGLHCSVDARVITEDLIIDFIKQYQDMGEPLPEKPRRGKNIRTEQLVWEGEPVKVYATRDSFPANPVKV